MMIGLVCGCSTQMEARQVLLYFNDYTTKTTQLFSSQDVADVSYISEIATALTTDETNRYTKLITEFEPTFCASLDYFFDYKSNLSSLNSEISKEDAGLIYDKFVAFRESADKFLVAKNNFESESYRAKFTDGSYVDSPITRARLEILMVNYSNMINASFELSNGLIALNNLLFTPDDFRIAITQMDMSRILKLLNETMSNLYEVAFAIDGMQFNFEVQVEENDATVYTPFNLFTSEVLEIVNLIGNLDSQAIATTMVNSPSDETVVKVRQQLELLNTNLDSFYASKDMFKNSVNVVSYKDFIDGKIIKSDFIEANADIESEYATYLLTGDKITLEQYKNKLYREELASGYETYYADLTENEKSYFDAMYEFLHIDFVGVTTNISNIIALLEIIDGD